MVSWTVDLEKKNWLFNYLIIYKNKFIFLRVWRIETYIKPILGLEIFGFGNLGFQ
jgi:hypothetical protein